MKIRMPENWKHIFTYAEVEAARRIIKEQAEDNMPVKEWAEMAVREALKSTGTCAYCVEVFRASAQISMNCRTLNAYFEGSDHLDVWLEVKAETSEGFIECGAYLSDIWQTGAVEYANRMYIRRARF